jgi:three-Cys-motif partner protein
MTTSAEFFRIARQQSVVKAAIVSKYFDAWATVMMATQDSYPKYPKRILYLDLFAGPGRYQEGGTESTPLLILRKAIENPKLADRLVTIFNDKDEANVRSLQSAIDSLPGIDRLRFKPEVRHGEVGTEIVKEFQNADLVPTFFFVDPWGYKGLSLQLINSVLKDWGCDCVFFFNYTRINMGLPNELVEEPLNALFGQDRADILRQQIDSLSPNDRELAIVEKLCEAIKETLQVSCRSEQRPHVLPFRFLTDSGRRTSHHLIFISKGFRGYEIMKGIMARESSGEIDGVPSFEYNPATMRQPFLFHFNQPLEDLKVQLLAQFKGQSITKRRIYEIHNIDTNFIKKNYTEVLLSLEQEGLITTSSSKLRRRGQMGDDVVITFPAIR